MNDDARSRPDDGSEALEFLNKEPRDMDEQPPRDDYEETPVQEEIPYEEDPPPARRRGLASAGGTNRVMIIAGVVVVVAALWIFWPRGGGGDLPAPVGEQYSVVANDSADIDHPQPARPRSSDVNLATEAPEVVPETPDAGAEASAAEPARTEHRPPPSDGEPSDEGKWAVQIGSFGSCQNALELAAELKAKGFRVETPTLQSTQGGSSTKVWIAYFRTHAEAKAWAAAHAGEVGKSTYITHR